MEINLFDFELETAGIYKDQAKSLCSLIKTEFKTCKTIENAWQTFIKIATIKKLPFEVHLLIFKKLFPKWPDELNECVAWMPDEKIISSSNITASMQQLDIKHYADFYQWSVLHYQDFWRHTIQKLGILFHSYDNEICNIKNNATVVIWFPGSKLNIVDSCFKARMDKVAIIYQDKDKKLVQKSYGELLKFVNQIAYSLSEYGIKSGDAIAICAPMDFVCVAIYLAIIKIGAVVVSIADSFASNEIALRLQIGKTKAIFVKDYISWLGKEINLLEKFSTIDLPLIILSNNQTSVTLKKQDILWQDFLKQGEINTSLSKNPMDACNILFSSGTTAQPKAIIWNHTTPIKVASDAHFHHNIMEDDVLAWPTNLGWMMGPWLIFAALINKAAIALYPEAPKGKIYAEFISQAKVTMLGTVPSLVSQWRENKIFEEVDLSNIKCFSSSGECSNPEDMLYLMSVANYVPIIEYCGGTEIGGAYISSTVIQANKPSLFSSPTLGTKILILDEMGKLSDIGEVAIVPPVIGLSTTLMNADHYQVYYQNMPTHNGVTLRRHGDYVKRFTDGYYALLGRSDDTMNLGGIKVSAAEIERILNRISFVRETAAISKSLKSGPSQLIIFAVLQEDKAKDEILHLFQVEINNNLNPLFKVYDVVLINELPKTASNKIMRRKLRDQYD